MELFSYLVSNPRLGNLGQYKCLWFQFVSICVCREFPGYLVRIGGRQPFLCIDAQYREILASLEQALAGCPEERPVIADFIKLALVYLRQIFMSPLTVGTALLHWPVESQ